LLKRCFILFLFRDIFEAKFFHIAYVRSLCGEINIDLFEITCYLEILGFLKKHANNPTSLRSGMRMGPYEYKEDKMKKIFIFDLDDTLYWNVHDYCYPMLEFEKFILDILGHKAPHISVMRKLEGEIDRGRVKEFGYSIDRFPGSLVETYRTICSRIDIPFDKRIAKKIWQIGMKAFDSDIYKRKGLIKDAEEVLNFLKEQGDELILLTKGDEHVQKLKIDALNLKRWFPDIFIVPSKTEALFRKIKFECSLLENYWFWQAKGWKEIEIYGVGNSFQSDIKPALEAGFSCIYIPYETWEFPKEEPEKALKEAGKNKLFIFQEIIEIKERYKEL